MTLVTPSVGAALRRGGGEIALAVIGVRRVISLANSTNGGPAAGMGSASAAAIDGRYALTRTHRVELLVVLEEYGIEMTQAE